MAKAKENMVLLSVYLPEGLNRHLRAIAFRNERSKNDLIQQLLQEGLKIKMADGSLPFEAALAARETARRKEAVTVSSQQSKAKRPTKRPQSRVVRTRKPG